MHNMISPPTLLGTSVRLEPLDACHAEALYYAGKNPQVWEWMSRGPFRNLEDAERWIAHAKHLGTLGEQIPFAIIDLETALAIGSTRFLNIDYTHKSLEIGYTWLTPQYWRTRINTECKYLLLSYAFDQQHVFRVQLVTDSRNMRSQKAIERLGAHKEGLIRSHRIYPDGHRRDSMFYSILDHEWPGVKTHLEHLLKS